MIGSNCDCPTAVEQRLKILLANRTPPEIFLISRLNLGASGEFQGNFKGCILYRAAVKITTGV